MNVFTALDYMGTKPTLYINGKTSYKTTLGGIISLIFSLCLIMGASYFLKLLISKEAFTISTSEEFYPDSFAIWRNLEFSIVLLNNYGLPYPDQDRLYGVAAMWMRWEDYIKPDNTKGAQMKMVPMKLEKCNLTKHYVDPLLWNNSNYLDLSYCTETNQNFNLSKTVGAKNFSMINIWVHRCKNTTFKNDCFSAEQIEQDLSNANVALRFKSYYFDHKKTKDIGMPYIFRDTSVGSTSLYRRLKFTMNEVEYITDDGFLFPTPVENKYVTFNSFRESNLMKVNPLVPGSLLEVSFEMHVLKQIIKKNYYKFQNMIADIGGLLKAVLTILTFFNNYFSDKLYFNDIIEQNICSMYEKKSSTNIVHIAKSNIESKVFNKSIGNSHLNLLNFKVDNPKSKNIIKNHNYEINYDPKISNLNVIAELNTDNANTKKSKVSELKLIQIITPLWCFNKKFCSTKDLRAHHKYKKFIIKLLDVRNILKRMNILDKISLILTGSENKHILESCINPNFYEDGQVQAPMVTEFDEVKNQILNTISDFILNSYVMEKNIHV
jgi:hypothetical protein